MGSSRSRGHKKQVLCPWGFSRQEYWSGLSCPPPEYLPNPGTEPRSPTLQADSLLPEHQGSPRILEWVAYPFSRGSSQPRNWTRVSCIAGGFFTNWAIREALSTSRQFSFMIYYLSLDKDELWNLKTSTNELIYKICSQTQKTNLWLPKGKWLGRDKLRVCS